MYEAGVDHELAAGQRLSSEEGRRVDSKRALRLGQAVWEVDDSKERQVMEVLKYAWRIQQSRVLGGSTVPMLETDGKVEEGERYGKCGYC